MSSEGPLSDNQYAELTAYLSRTADARLKLITTVSTSESDRQSHFYTMCQIKNSPGRLPVLTVDYATRISDYLRNLAEEALACPNEYSNVKH